MNTWTWSKAVSTAGDYKVTITFAKRSSRLPGQDVLSVTTADGITRKLDPYYNLTPSFTTKVGSTLKLTLTLGYASGAPYYTGITAAAVPVASSTTTRKLLWSDEFNGPAGGLPSGTAWDAQEGAGWGAGQLQSYTRRAENARLDGAGDLDIIARKESYTGDDGEHAEYTSARLQTLGRFSFTYGRIEARMKLPAGAGLWPAFWTLGDDIETKGWPECGEIDVMETIGSLPNELNGTVHAPLGEWNGLSDSDGAEWTIGKTYNEDQTLTTAYHVYAVEWKPDSLVFSIDNKVYATITKASMPAGGRWPFDKPHHLLLNMAVGGEWPGSPTSATQFPAVMSVDYVRIYAPVS